MNKLTDRARVSVLTGREQRRETIVNQQDSKDNKKEFNLTYDGYEYGRHWGLSANGGRMPVTPISPGTIRRGELFVGVRGVGGAILASWMP